MKTKEMMKKPWRRFVEEIVAEISEEGDMDKDEHGGFLISDEYHSNDHDNDIEAESIISTTHL